MKSLVAAINAIDRCRLRHLDTNTIRVARLIVEFLPKDYRLFISMPVPWDRDHIQFVYYGNAGRRVEVDITYGHLTITAFFEQDAYCIHSIALEKIPAVVLWAYSDKSLMEFDK